MSSSLLFGGLVASAPERLHTMETPEMVAFAIKRLGLKSSWSEKYWKGDVPFHCPYHTDKTPSLMIHFQKGYYHCFGCDKSGHITQLYWDLVGSSLLKDTGQAVDEFSRFAYSGLQYQYEEPDYSTIGRDIQVIITGKVVAADQHILSMRYLRKRGITVDVARKMQMSFMEYGYIKGSAEVSPTLFSNRLLIPVYEKGKLISVEGRDVLGTQDLKVLYPKDSSVNSLYDLDKLDKTKTLYGVEGLIDLAVLRSDPYFEHSTSIFGAALTKRQIWLLNQFEDFVYIPDNDKAGRATLSKMKEYLEKPFRVLDVPRLSDIKDVGEIVTKLHTTVEALRKRGWGRVLRNSNSIMM